MHMLAYLIGIGCGIPIFKFVKLFKCAYCKPEAKSGVNTQNNKLNKIPSSKSGMRVSKMLTAWKVSKRGVFSGPYFPAFGPNTEGYGVSLCIQSECGKIRTGKNSVFGHFSRSG